MKSGSIFVLPFFLVFSISANADEKWFPLKKDDEGRFLIDVFVGEAGPFSFLIDTAASNTVIYDNLVIELGLQSVPFKSKRVYTATGLRRLSVYPVEQISLMGMAHTLGDVPALPARNHTTYGVVGVDFMKGRIFKISDNGSKISFLTSVMGLDENWMKVNGRYVGYGFIAIDVDLNGTLVPTVVDTGASNTVLNIQGRSILTKPGARTVVNDGVRVKAAGRSITAEQMFFKTMRIGDLKYADEPLTVSNLPVFHTFGATTVPAMILGLDFLGTEPMILDMRHMDLYLDKRGRRRVAISPKD